MQRYPLSWPAGWQRTELGNRKYGHFHKMVSQTGNWKRKQDLSVFDAIKRVLGELARLGVREGDSIISTNLQTRLDGLPRSDQREPKDPGAAVYWQLNGQAPKVMAIDQYTTVADNLAAIAATLEALRAIERHGGALILDRAFTGFDALPAPGKTRHWRDVLDVPEGGGNTADQLARAKMHYRACASANHPDKAGGSNEKMAEINRAWQQAQEELGNG